ncbi:MAG: hypothetical protein GX442_04440 [Candidatus Riflebacteria bacterium]|nr:hypothetical protein [Candidatus Riflebacteria bacterium]
MIRTTRRGSVILLVVMGTLLFLGLLGFSLYRSLSEKAHFVNIHSTSILMDTAAVGIAALVCDSLGSEMAKTDSDLFKTLVTTESAGFPLDVSNWSSLWTGRLGFLERKEFAYISHKVKAVFDNPVALNAGGPWQDPWEKHLRLSLTITLSYGRLGVRPFTKVYRFGRPARVQHLALPVLGKFTFFLAKPETTDETHEGYNCFENAIGGGRLQTSKVLPLVLFNHPEYKKTNLTSCGYIFLGGTTDLQLHLTSGPDTQNGEFFQFFNINNPSANPPVVTASDLPSTPSFTQPVLVASGSFETARLGIQKALLGFYLVDQQNPPGDMNFKNALERFFSGTTSRTMKSSFLHLYGNLQNPSPAVVFGRVYRVFGQYSFLTVDLDQDGVHEYRWDILRTPADYQTLSGESSSLWKLVRLPTQIKKKKSNEVLEANPNLTLEILFGTPAQYLDAASQIIVQTYNAGYDYLLNPDMKFLPPDTFKGQTGLDHLQTGEKVSLAHSGKGATLFQGNLHTLTGKDLLTDRVTWTASSPEEVFAEFRKGNDLDLRGQTVFVDTPLTIPANLSVTGPGTLICRGDLTIKGDLKSGTNPIPFTLVAVGSGSNILLDGQNQEVHAELVALAGTIRPTKTTNHPRIRGGVAMQSLIPQDWAAGGEITWLPIYDPTTATTDGYSCVVAGHYDEWGVESQ